MVSKGHHGNENKPRCFVVVPIEMESLIDVTTNELIRIVEVNHVVEIVWVRISKYVKMGTTE